MRNPVWFVALLVIVTAVALLMTNNNVGSTFGVDNDLFARHVWLGTFLTVICASIFRRGGLGGAGIAQLAIWLAIFVALVAGYKIYHNEPLFPGDTPPPRTSPDSGTGITASLMDSVHSRLHLVSPRNFG